MPARTSTATALPATPPASDPEDGPLSGAAVVWTTDRDAAPLGSGLSITVVLPASGPHVVTCTATDSDGNAGSDSITVVAQSPVAEIWHPGDGEVRVAGSSIPFSGTARDREDGTLTGAAPPAAGGVWAPPAARRSLVVTTAEAAPERIGQRAVCRVTGETFIVTKNTPAIERDGQLQLFCCADCSVRFLAGAPPSDRATGGGG
ncbi:MAG: hypothetical protein HY905_22025 [Deltaproteobacteria bacterium]|nr:hypothetical protein [Deltaproteobacteria bacterium]